MLDSMIGKFLRRPKVACLRIDISSSVWGVDGPSQLGGPRRTFVPRSSKMHKLTQLDLPYFLTSFSLGYMIMVIVAFHKVTLRNTLLSSLRVSKGFCFSGLNSIKFQNFTTLSAVGWRSDAKITGSCNSNFRV